MKTYKKWNDIKHKASPEQREINKQEALAEYDRMGYAAVRKARELTQVEVAATLGVNQASVSAMEKQSDMLLSTLSKYIRALGGEIEIRAVFPNGTFNLEPFPPASEPASASAKIAAARRA